MAESAPMVQYAGAKKAKKKSAPKAKAKPKAKKAAKVVKVRYGY